MAAPAKLKTYHGLVDVATGKYWRGNLPANSHNGRLGKVSTYIRRWRPQMVTEGLAQTWVRESTALDKLKMYELIRIVRPDVPKLALRKYVIKPTMVGQYELQTPNERTQCFSKLFYLYGDQIAADWDSLNVYDVPKIIYFARCSTLVGCITASTARKHLTASKVKGQSVFMTEDDAVMLRMLAPKTKLYDMREIFGSPVEFEAE